MKRRITAFHTKDINGYEGLYTININGEIWAKTKIQKGRPGRKSHVRKGFKKKIHINGGYPSVVLSKDNKTKHHFLHRLIYENYIGVIPSNLQINHKDGNKLNYNLSNLEVVTCKENVRHAWKTKLAKPLYGEENNNSRITNDVVKNIRKDRLNGLTYKYIAKKYNISISSVFNVCKKLTWKHVT